MRPRDGLERVRVLVRKEFRQVFRDRRMLPVIFVAPIVPRRGLRTFNVLAALFIPLENALRRLAPLPFGQSLVCIARHR